MGSKKHKKHKSERRERESGKEKSFSLDRPPSLKLILKVSGNSSTPEHGNDSPAYGIQSDGGSTLFTSTSGDYPERHKKSKKKKKKKDREKKHKHHHKEKRHRHRGDDSSHGEEDEEEEDFNSYGDESSQATAAEPVHYPAASSVAAAAVAAVASSSLAAQPVTKPLLPEALLTPKLESDLEQESIPEHDRVMLGGGGLVPKEELTTAPSSVTTDEPLQSPGSMQSSSRPGSKIDFHDTSSSQAPKTPNSDCSGREPRSCVLKQKQSRSPLNKLLDHLLKALEKRDPHQFFAWPVTDDIAPGYSSIILKPMDFSTIRQKIEDNEYGSVSEFSDDFKLMCENAIKYNHSETVYHKAAKKLLHVGARLLQTDNLMRSLRPLMTYMRELTAKELGFELPIGTGDGTDSDFHHQHHTADSADEAMAAAVDEGINAQIEEEEKRKQIRLENNPHTKFEAFVDDLTADEVLAQVQSAALNARTKLLKRKSAHKLGFLRQHKDGTTSMKILLDTKSEGGEGGPERTVTLGAHTGKLQYGTGQLQGFREDRRNSAKIVKPLSYGAFSSFAPVFDSRFANLSKEETEMVLNTYGCETGADYAESILRFAMDSTFAAGMAHNLLDVLTNGEHRQTYGKLYESHMQREERDAVRHTFLDPVEVAEEVKRYANVPVDFDSLRSLSSLGVDMEFLDELELQLKGAEIGPQLQQSLSTNSDLLQKLHQLQTDRLSAPLPAHLSHIQHPSEGELELAGQITSNLTAIAKQLPPAAIANPQSLRKAMGISTAGLDIFQPPLQTNAMSGGNQPSVPAQSLQPVPQVQQQQNGNGTASHPTVSSISNTNQLPTPTVDIDTTPMDMDLEPEPISHHHHQHHPHPHHLTRPAQQQQSSAQQQHQLQHQSIIQANPVVSAAPSVDIDSELREFLGGSTLNTAGPSTADGTQSSDAACIEQMLMD
ncbi:bromodomain-containing protein 7 [Anopheles maculipalpis]|uniref:bromodomain-containing protein 7 n=1 Tax=Anopheles maculipalpis TaxID=1496333 RepID=UPI0021596F5F|nr:bromodomain-containing protein 7 [Anopheles maculipalpis]